MKYLNYFRKRKYIKCFFMVVLVVLSSTLVQAGSSNFEEKFNEALEKKSQILENHQIFSESFDTQSLQFEADDLSYWWQHYVKAREGMKRDGYDTYEDWFRYVHRYLFAMDLDGDLAIKDSWIVHNVGPLILFGLFCQIIGPMPNMPLGLSLLGFGSALCGFGIYSTKITHFIRVKEHYDALWTKEINIHLRIKDNETKEWIEDPSSEMIIQAYNKEIPDAYEDEFNDNWEDKFLYRIRKEEDIKEPGWFTLSAHWEDPFVRFQPPFSPGFWVIEIPDQSINGVNYKGITFETYDIHNCGSYVNQTISLDRNYSEYPVIHRNTAIPEHGAMNVELDTNLSVEVSDPQDNYMTIKFYTNATTNPGEPWQCLDCTYDGVRSGRFNCSTEDIFNDYNTTYYWKVEATDQDFNRIESEPFKFTTENE